MTTTTPPLPSRLTSCRAAKAVQGASDILNAQKQVTIPKTQIGVAVLDTGYYPHPDINFNVAAGYDFINRDADALDKFGSCTSGHGLSIAGIIVRNHQQQPEHRWYRQQRPNRSGEGDRLRLW